MFNSKGFHFGAGMAFWSQLAIVSQGLHGVTWLLEAMCFAACMVCFLVFGFEECWSTQTHRHARTNKATSPLATLVSWKVGIFQCFRNLQPLQRFLVDF